MLVEAQLSAVPALSQNRAPNTDKGSQCVALAGRAGHRHCPAWQVVLTLYSPFGKSGEKRSRPRIQITRKLKYKLRLCFFLHVPFVPSATLATE